MGQKISLENAEHRLLDMGVEAWRLGLVGRTANARVRTFDVPIGSGVLAPSPKGPDGLAPIPHELHIHTALCESLGDGDAGGVDGAGPAVSVTRASWGEEREQLTPGGPDAVPVLFMHGYGSGIGIFSQVLPGVARSYKSGPVFAIDTLGCGLSSRPAIDGHWGAMTVRQAEDFFVADGIERWRRVMGYSKLRLVGHSIGGYLAVTYAERYPERVEQVVTVGCAGLPPVPEGFEAKMRAKWPWLAPVALSMWTHQISPFNIMRYGLGSTFFSRYARRWDGLPWFTEIERLRDYLHLNWTSGEVSAGGYAHVTLLSLAAFAKDPLHARIPSLKLDTPLTMLYGESDWMNPENAIKLRDELRGATSGTVPVVEVAKISQGGHNIPLENPTGLVDAILEALSGGAVDGKTYNGAWAPASAPSKVSWEAHVQASSAQASAATAAAS